MLTEGFPVRLRDARVSRALSMRELAKRTDITQPTITAYERGERFPELRVAERLALALDVNVCWLAFGIGPQTTTSTAGTKS